MIVQNVSRDGRTDVSFTAPKDDLARLAGVMERVRAEIQAEGVQIDEGVGKVSLVGAGMKSHPGVAAGMFAALAAEGINIEMISTSTIRVSCVVRAADAERAVRHLAAVGLPTHIKDVPAVQTNADALMALIAQDKKVRRGKLTFILLRGIGQAFVAPDVDPDEVRAFLAEKLE